ncbi:MAG TPA: S53 family peptidase, partial [Acidimicrobiia bacterium]|nr:S53 family peptidase [Acidimicrobiia bacterium]
VAAFQNCYGVHPNVTRVTVDGGTADTSGAGEVMLDADIVMGQVPNAQILVYVAPNSDAGAIDEYRTIVNEDRAQVISISWGLCETYQGSSGARAENNLFKQAAAQGQSIFAASGDDGSADCYGIDGTTTLAVDDPASQPFVTGVGGTTLSSTVPRREAVWNAGGYGGGGGVSQLWSMPTYQAGVHLAGSAPCGAAGCRQVPDVAASADPAHGYPVYCSVRTACGRGGWMAFGGTSGAAPLWASAAVLVNEACGPQRRLGFANPALYSAAPALNDTDAGNNDAVGGNGGAFSAGSGYDLATGLGTPNVAALAAALCGTAPIAVDPGTGPGPSDPAPVVTVPTRSGYWMLAADGRVFPFGDAAWYGDAVSGIAPQMAAGVRAAKLEPTGTFAGYWIVDSAGHVYAFGDAASLGQAATGQLAAGERVTSLSRTPTGRGYWLFTTRGRVLPFGDAAFYGDMSAAVLNGPVLGSIATTSGHGYYMVASDGGIFAFGDARFQGSMGAARLNAAVQSLVPTADGAGYWLVASDGGIFAFGDAPFRGAMGGQRLNAPVSGMVRFADGYLMVAADGGIFDFSD